VEGHEHSIHFTPGIGGKPYTTLFLWALQRKEYST